MDPDRASPTDRGSSTAAQRQALLAAFGVDSTVVPDLREALAEVIRDGNCGTLNAVARVLWNAPRHVGGGHAMTVTGGTFDADGCLATIPVNDTGTGERHEMPADEFFAATEARRQPDEQSRLLLPCQQIWPRPESSGQSGGSHPSSIRRQRPRRSLRKSCPSASTR